MQHSEITAPWGPRIREPLSSLSLLKDICANLFTLTCFLHLQLKAIHQLLAVVQHLSDVSAWKCQNKQTPFTAANLFPYRYWNSLSHISLLVLLFLIRWFWKNMKQETKMWKIQALLHKARSVFKIDLCQNNFKNPFLWQQEFNRNNRWKHP